MKTVHEVCMMTGVTRKRLFYYDRIGLLKPTRRVGPQKAKMYGAKAIERLQMIIRYQQAGLRISEISMIIDAEPSAACTMLEEVIDRLHKEENQIVMEIAAARDLLAKIRNQE